MTSNLPTPDDVSAVVTTGARYARDLVERVLATFVVAFAGVAVAAGPADMFSASFWESAGAAAVAAVGSLLKGLAAKFVGNKDSASTASGV